jgi:hypothetical protein
MKGCRIMLYIHIPDYNKTDTNKSEENAGISSYLSNVVQVVNFWRKTSMDTEELLVHEGSKWQAVECFHACLIYTF